MKKINFVMIFCLLLLATVVIADNEFGNIVRGSKLLITDIDVKVDSKTHKDLNFGDKIKYEAKPGSIVELGIEAKNNFTKDQKLEIEHIEVMATIEKIDDGDDVEREEKEFDLKSGKDNRVKLQFQIPLDVKEGNYNVLIQAKGKDDDGITHKVEYELSLEVKKERYEIYFFKHILVPLEITCNKYTTLEIGIINTGSKDLDNVGLQVLNPELGIDIGETFNLDNRPFKKDNRFEKEFTFTLPDDVKAGTYPIVTKVSYNNCRNEKQENVLLVINECKKDIVSEKQNTKNETKKKEQLDLVVLPGQQVTPKKPSGSLAPIKPSEIEKGIFETSELLIILLIGEALLVLILVISIASFASKRRMYNRH